MRCNKKQYYHQIVGATCSTVLNSIIEKHNRKVDYPSYFVKNQNVTINNVKEVADEFNCYFVKVGPTLANY